MKTKWTTGLLLALPFSVFSQGFQVNLQGQKQTAMGGAGSALTEDVSAVFYNPGAVARLKENGFMLGGNVTMAKVAFQESGNSTVYQNENKYPTPFNAYGVWGPKDARWKLGLGVYTPFGSTISWGSNWPGNNILTSMALSSIYIQPTLSYLLSEDISIGAGFVYNHASVDLQKDLPVINSDGTTPGHTRLKGTGYGMGYNLGVHFKLADDCNFGVSYRSAVKTKVKDGDMTFTNIPTSLASSFPTGTTFNSTLALPDVLAVGFSYDRNPKTTYVFDVNFVFWSTYKNLTFDYNQAVAGKLSSTSPQNYKDVVIFRAGVQHKYTEKFALRAGAFYGLSPVQDGYVAPTTPDANRLGLTAGIGYKVSSKIHIDASFMYQYVKPRTQKNLETGLSGTYASHIYIPGISISYKL